MKINKLLNIALLINHPAIYAGLNDTGITTCSNETQNGLPCPVAGFPGQDAEYGTNSFNFTKLDANGNAMAVIATNHTCVKDNVTGLIWEVKTDDGGLRDKDNTYTFDQAATFAANVNATNLCGHNDWRVPNPHELTSIVDYSIAYPALTIDEDFFPYTSNNYSSNNYYWTNAQYAADSSGSWVVNFNVGGVYGYNRSNYGAVRLVRVGQWLLPLVFTDQGNGTVTEANTGLMWAKCSVGQGVTDCSGSASSLTWQQALQAADNSTLAGYTDWRLPNVKELQTIVDYTKHNPSINPSVFPNTSSSWYYSSSPYASRSSASWFVYFGDGSVGGYGRSGSYFVRCVRLGQWLLPFALNVAKAGNGAGSVLSTPAGINCGSDCNENYASGTVVKITATAATGSVFGGWSGACSPAISSNVCTVTMNAAKTVTATFNLAPKPDFTIPVMTITPAVPVTNGTFTATVMVKNQGTVAADGGQLRLWANQTTAPACAATGGNQNVAVGTIAAGSSKTFTITGLNAGVSGPKTLRAFVDATCAKVESNETNNHRTLSYRVAGRKPDLVITNITLTPATPAKNTLFNAVITVKNQGSNVAGGSFLDVWTNQATAATCGTVGNVWADVGGLAAGASTVVNVTGLNAGATAGAKTLRAFVDSWCEETESNEANNQLIKSYTVQ